jgi:hypothetical protein
LNNMTYFKTLVTSLCLALCALAAQQVPQTTTNEEVQCEI